MERPLSSRGEVIDKLIVPAIERVELLRRPREIRTAMRRVIFVEEIGEAFTRSLLADAQISSKRQQKG